MGLPTLTLLGHPSSGSPCLWSLKRGKRNGPLLAYGSVLFQTEALGLPTPKGPIFFPEDAAFEGFLTVCGFRE